MCELNCVVLLLYSGRYPFSLAECARTENVLAELQVVLVARVLLAKEADVLNVKLDSEEHGE